MGETDLKNEIALAQFIKKVNESFGTTGQIHQAIFQASFDLAEKIHSSLRSIETLKRANKQNSNSTTPVGLDKGAYQICPEILAWSISILRYKLSPYYETLSSEMDEKQKSLVMRWWLERIRTNRDKSNARNKRTDLNRFFSDISLHRTLYHYYGRLNKREIYTCD